MWMDWTGLCVMGGLESGGRGIGIGLSERDRREGEAKLKRKPLLLRQ
jgi:hypothetical protein